MSGLAVLRAARLEQLEGLRRARDLDAMLIHAQGGALGAATRSHAYLRMFVDWDGLESPSSLLLTAHCRTLILSNPFQLRAARRVEGVDAVVCAAPALLGETVRGLLARHDARIGEAGALELAMQAAVSMQQALPRAGIEDIAPELDRWRWTKAPAEVEALTRAAALCDAVFARFPALLRADREAWRTQREVEHFALMNGAEYCKTWLTIDTAAQTPQYLAQENTQRPAPGDQVLLGLMLKLDGYWGHAIRMGSFVSAQPEHRRLHGVVRVMFDAALAQFQARADPADAERAMSAILARQLPDFAPERLFRFRSGHGLGLSYEEPATTAAFPQYADPSATGEPESLAVPDSAMFELHPNVFVKGLGGAALGDMVQIDAQGCRRLLATPLDFNVWG